MVALEPGLDLPTYAGVRHETWALPDPAGWDIDAIRPLRVYLEGEVERVIAELVDDRTTGVDVPRARP